jgi:hypothetical protein
MMVTAIIMKAGAALQTDQSPQETEGMRVPSGRTTLVLRFIEMSGIRKLRKCVVSTLRARTAQHSNEQQPVSTRWCSAAQYNAAQRSAVHIHDLCDVLQPVSIRQFPSE